MRVASPTSSSARTWDAPLICNTEKEIDGSGKEYTSYIAAQIGEREAAISVEANPFSSVEWWPLSRYVVLPQLFPAETGFDPDEGNLRRLWQAWGIDCVVMTYGSYAGMKPNDFLRLSPYGIYAADDCGADYQSWASRGTRIPCKTPTPPPEEIMEKIGSQHGITGFMKWLREQEGVPQPGPNFNSEDVDTWPWPNKIERTLTILAKDHDESAG